jgi:hypothetical protein
LPIPYEQDSYSDTSMNCKSGDAFRAEILAIQDHWGKENIVDSISLFCVSSRITCQWLLMRGYPWRPF